MLRVADATVKKCCRGLCTAWTCPGTFHKVGGLGQENLNVYHYYSNINDLDRNHEDSEKAKHGLILQNTSSCDIAIGNITNGIDHSRCNCQRCYESLNHICEMLHKVNVVKKQRICGICDHCKKDYHKSVRNKCEHCNEIIRSFMYLLQDGRECPRLKEWFRKIRHLPCAMIKGLKQNSLMSPRTLNVDELFPDDFIQMQRHKSAHYNEDIAGLDGSKFKDENRIDQTQRLEIAEYNKKRVGIDQDTFKKEKGIRSNSEDRALEKAQKNSKRKAPSSIKKKENSKVGSNRNIPTTHKGKSVKNDAILKLDGNIFEKTKKKQEEKVTALKSEFLNESGLRSKGFKKSDQKNSDASQKLSNKDNNSTEVLTRKKKNISDATTNELKTQKDKEQSSDKKDTQYNSEIERIQKKGKSEKGGADNLLGHKKGKSDVTEDISVQKKTDLKEVKAKVLEGDVLEKIKKVPDASLNDKIIKPEIKATLSQMRIFEAKAKEQRNHIVDDNNKVKSTMSSYNKEIERRLALDKLPQVGKIFQTYDNISANNSIDQIIHTERKRMHEHCFETIDNLAIKAKEQHGVAEAEKSEYGKIIVGNKVRKRNFNLLSKPDHDKKPLLFKINEGDDTRTAARGDSSVNENFLNKNFTKKDGAYETKSEQSKGIIRYALSDRQFIDKGWTMLPTEKIFQKMNVYRMKIAQPEYDWFYRNRKRCPMSYDTGERLAEIDENGDGRWFYRNGLVALDYYSAEGMNRRFIVYSSEKMDNKLGKKPMLPTVLACFDWIGNGIVYDHSGNIRLKYNQTEGILLEKSLGPTTHWKWHALNDPPILQQVIVDTQLSHKELKIMQYTDASKQPKETADDEEEMVAIEYESFANEKRKKLSHEFKPFKIKAKVLKINDTFSLRVLDQASVCLVFRDGKNSLKLNLGMSLDPREIVDTDTIEVGEVANSYDKLPARTESLARIQEIVANAKKLTKRSMDHQQRIKRPERQLSVERFKSALYTPTKLVKGP